METVKYNQIFSERNKPVFGISDPDFLALYYFFSNHEQDTEYLVEDIPESVDIEQATVNLFGAYGIMFEQHAITSDERVEQQFVIIPASELDDHERLSFYVQKIRSTNLIPTHCIVEKDLTKYSIDDCDKLMSIIRKEIPFVTIINPLPVTNTKVLVSNQSSLSHLEKYVNPLNQKKFNFIDVTEKFINISESSLNSYIKQCLEIIGYVDNLNLTEEDILTIDFSKVNKQVVFAYYAVAAYLLLDKGIKSYIPMSDFSIFTSFVNRAKSNAYMFVDDYLFSLQNFPDFSISFRGDINYLWIKNKNAINNPNYRDRYSIKIMLYRAPIDLKNWKVGNFDDKPLILSLNQLKSILKFREVCDIGSNDFDKASASFKTLNDVCSDINCQLSKLKILAPDEFVNVNNLLLYEQGGLSFIAYVASINGKIPFNVCPLLRSWAPFSVDLSINDLQGLNDIALYYDSPAYIEPIKRQLGKTTDITKRFYDHETLRGIILKGYRPRKNSISPDAGLTFSEVGMWSTQTSEFREHYRKSFSELFNKQAILDKQCISFFGFKHPQISGGLSLSLDDKDWRLT